MPKYKYHTNHTHESIKIIEKITILKRKSCKGKIQRYTRPLKTSPEPERSSALPNSQLELIYYLESLALIL